jgi:hypothetical protein
MIFGKRPIINEEFISRKEKAYQSIMFQFPDSSLIGVDICPVLKIKNGSKLLYFIPLDNDLYAFRLIDTFNNVEEKIKKELHSWSLGNLNDIAEILNSKV